MAPYLNKSVRLYLQALQKNKQAAVSKQTAVIIKNFNFYTQQLHNVSGSPYLQVLQKVN